MTALLEYIDLFVLVLNLYSSMIGASLSEYGGTRAYLLSCTLAVTLRNDHNISMINNFSQKFKNLS